MAIKFLSGLNLSNVTAGSILKLDSNGNIVAAVDGTDYNTGSADSWSDVGSNIYRNSDVRIGTYQSGVAPAARLHVFDYQTTDPKLLIEDGNTGDASMEFKISTQSYTMGIDNSDSDKFVIAASTALGTTNVLEISTAGAAAFQGDLLVNGNALASTFIAPAVHSKSKIRLHGTGNDAHSIGTAAYANTYGPGTWDSGTIMHQFYGSSGDIIAQLGVGGSTSSANTSYFTGNVGIGTTDPSEKLHVVGNALFHSGANLGRIKVGRSTNQEIEIYVDDTNNIITAYQDSDSNGSHVFALNREFDGSGANYFEIRKGGSAQMHIDTSGNVGIGTTNPSSSLHIYKSSGTTTSSTGTTLLTLENYVGSDLKHQKSFIDFVLKDDNTNETPQVRIGAEVGNNDLDASTQAEEGMGAFVVYTNNADTNSGAAGTSLAERFRVDRNGRVGIGTNNPAQKLHVAGDIYTTSDFLGNSIISAGAALTISNTGIQPDQGDVEDIVAFNFATTKVAHIDTDGYIHATGFKTSGTTGFLKSDGTVATGSFFSGAYNDLSGKPTLGTMAAAATSDYKTSDATETYVGLELASYTLTSALGTAATTASTDYATAAQGTTADAALPKAAGSGNKLTDALYIQGTNTTNAESVLVRGISSNNGDWLGSIRTANTGGYNQEMRFYTSNADGTTNENLTLTLIKPISSPCYYTICILQSGANILLYIVYAPWGRDTIVLYVYYTVG